MTQRLPVPTGLTKAAAAVTALVIAATAAYLNAMFSRIPFAIPMRFENGEPVIFARKTATMVYLPAGIQLVLAVIFAALVVLLLWRARPHDADEADAADGRRMQHAAEAVSLLGMVWISFQAVSAWRLVELWKRGYGGLGEVYGLAMVTAITLTIVVFARAVVLVGHSKPLATEMNVAAWRRGHYVDRDNPALFVPVAAGGAGLTVNFGRSVTAFLLVAVLGAGVGGPFYLAWVAFRNVLGTYF